jgi:hypothetical protein
VGGEIDVILGHHFTPFVSKIVGTHLTWLAIAQNCRDYKLVTKPGVSDFGALEGKTIAIADNPCLGINMQLMLRQMGLEGKTTVVSGERGGYRVLLDLVQTGQVDGTFVDVPADLDAKRRGLIVHENDPALDIVAGECITTIPRFMTEKDHVLKAVMKTYLHAISLFTTKPDVIKEMVRNNSKIRAELTQKFKVEDEELLDRFLHHWSSRWERKPYPSLKALDNAHEKATRYDARCATVNPLTVVDTHYVKELDESGFIDNLYK